MEGMGSKGVQLVAVACVGTSAWWKKEQGSCVVGCGVGKKKRGHLSWARQRARRGRAGEPPTVHQGQCPPHQKKATSHQQKPMLQQCTATPPAMVARGKRAARERSEGTCHQGCQTAQKEEVEGGGKVHSAWVWQQRRTCGRCWCQLTALHCTGHRAHTRRASKREEWECEQKKKKEPNG